MKKLTVGKTQRSQQWASSVLLGTLLCICWCWHSGCNSTKDAVINLPTPSQTIDRPPAVILLIGDGMGLTHATAAMYMSKTPLALERFPVIGLQKTHSGNNLVTDSAAGATAMACGVKTYNSAIGVDLDTVPRITILEQAKQNGLATGVVVTSTIVHATPASFMAHQPLRVYYEEIAEDVAKANVDFLVGGGKRYFDRRKKDDRNLLKEMESEGYVVADYFDGNLKADLIDVSKPFFYLTADNQPLPVYQGRSYLPFASELGARYLDLRGEEEGFMLVIEGSQIDWANHARQGRWAIQETLDFDRTIRNMLDFAERRGNTLVIVTADHESGGMALQNGSKLLKVKTEFTTNGHTASMVPVYAYGPGSEAFSGIYDNTTLCTKIRNYFSWDIVK